MLIKLETDVETSEVKQKSFQGLKAKKPQISSHSAEL